MGETAGQKWKEMLWRKLIMPSMEFASHFSKRKLLSKFLPLVTLSFSHFLLSSNGFNYQTLTIKSQ